MTQPPFYDQPDLYLIVAAFLLAVGIYGLIRRRTLIGMLISGELIFSAASLNLMAFNRFHGSRPGGRARFSCCSSWACGRRDRHRPEHHHRGLSQLSLRQDPGAVRTERIAQWNPFTMTSGFCWPSWPRCVGAGLVMATGKRPNLRETCSLPGRRAPSSSSPLR